jgi:hypothetical protein
MTKEEYANSFINIDYDEYQDWVVSNYDVDDIDDEVFEKAINDAIYSGYMEHLYRLSDDENYLGGDDDNDDWLIDDYDILYSDIKYKIRESLGLN